MMDSIANRRTADAAFGPGCASPDCRAGRRGMDVTPASHGFWILGNICALAMGLTAIARSPALALGIMMPLLFLDQANSGSWLLRDDLGAVRSSSRCRCRRGRDTGIGGDDDALRTADALPGAGRGRDQRGRDR